MLPLLDLHSITIYLYYDLTKSLKSLIYVLEPKNLNYPEPTSFIVNDGTASLLGNIINKDHMRIIKVQGELLFTLLKKIINKAIIT